MNSVFSDTCYLRQTVKDPKQVRAAMLRMFIVFCGMVDNARDTVTPVFEFIESEYPEMAAEIEAALNSKQESGECLE